MKFQLLPSTFDETGVASARQHTTCFVVDDCVAFDAGSLAMSCSDKQRENIRDILLTHVHLDHIAGLPLFIDDLYANLKDPIRVHALPEVIEVLERDIFNWSVYPRFSELKNESGAVMKYEPFLMGKDFEVKHLLIHAVAVNHRVPSAGFIISDRKSVIAMTGDTSSMDEFWNAVNDVENLAALLIECAFPDELQGLADMSHHLTPQRLEIELGKFEKHDCPIFVINLKPMYRDRILERLDKLKINCLQVLDVGRIYDW